MKKNRVLLLLFSVVWLVVSPLSAQSAPFHTATDWRLKPSLKYDTLCLLNVLSGDPYYLHYYQTEYDHFHPLFTADEDAAFVAVKRAIKDDGGGIVSATLSLYYSTVDDETLPEMIRTAHDSSAMETALRKTTYWSEPGWKSYEAARPALEVALKALQRVGFSAYWEEHAKARVEQRIAELTPDLPRYNIIPAVEGLLGFALPSQTITVYILAYSEPHGIRITGLRFLSHVRYPFSIVLHNAIHESMHPPYHADDPAVHAAIERLGSDPLIVDKVEHHDHSFGYNTAAGLIEEDSVQALEEIVSEKFGVGHDARAYWQKQDDGMHVLAVAIYTGYKQALVKGPETYSQWFVHAVDDGQLLGEELRNAVAQFFGRVQ